MYLNELEDEWIEKIGTIGVGTSYVFKGLKKNKQWTHKELKHFIIELIKTLLTCISVF